jgi:peroxiredoxin
MPILDRLHKRYEDTGFAVLGVNVEGESAPAQKVVDKTNVTFPVLIDEGLIVSVCIERTLLVFVVWLGFLGRYV